MMASDGIADPLAGLEARIVLRAALAAETSRREQAERERDRLKAERDELAQWSGINERDAMKAELTAFMTAAVAIIVVVLAVCFYAVLRGV